MAIASQVNKRTTISTAITSGSTTFTLSSAVFTNFTYGYLVVDYDNPALLEVISVSVSGSTATIVTRAQDGTSAQDHAIGAKVAWILTKSDFDRVANRTLGYAQITSDFTTTTTPTSVDVTGLSVAVTVPIGGARIKITAYAYGFYTSGATGVVTAMAIQEGATVLSQMRRDMELTNSPDVGIVVYTAVATAGAHTYKVTISQNGAGTLRVQAAPTAPAFILVENIE
jgi:hypothetical protein